MRHLGNKVTNVRAAELLYRYAANSWQANLVWDSVRPHVFIRLELLQRMIHELWSRRSWWSLFWLCCVHDQTDVLWIADLSWISHEYLIMHRRRDTGVTIPDGSSVLSAWVMTKQSFQLLCSWLGTSRKNQSAIWRMSFFNQYMSKLFLALLPSNQVDLLWHTNRAPGDHGSTSVAPEDCEAY